MENKGVAKEANDIESSYQIINFRAKTLPVNYEGIVYSKWLRSLKFGNDYFRLIDNNSYYDIYHQYIEQLMQRPDSVVRFAVLSDDSDVVLGFSLTEGDILHYVHVHRDQRKLGIGTQLLPSPFNRFTHITKAGLSIWPKYPKAIFNPFA